MKHRLSIHQNTHQESRQLSFAARSLLWLGKLTAVSPIVVYKDTAGSYTVKSTAPNVFYSLTLFVVVHVFSAASAVYLYIGYDAISTLLKWYLYLRIILTFLTHANCLWNQKNIEDGFRSTLGFPFMLPIRFLIVPLSTILTIFIVSLFLNQHFFKSRIRVILSIPLDIIPPIINILMCSHFASQVEALRGANIKVNQDIFRLLTGYNSMDLPTLRDIMREHNGLHSIATHLNETYGMSMLLVTFEFLLETIVCGEQFTEYIKNEFGVLCFFWVFCHITALFWTMYTCQRAEDVSKETRALSMDLSTILTKEDLERTTWFELREWELQLRHQRVQFVPCGCFGLSGQQIKTITATSISYGIIIFQNFRLRYHLQTSE